MATRPIYVVSDADKAGVLEQLGALQERLRSGSLNPAVVRECLQCAIGWRVPFRTECVWEGPFEDFWPVDDCLVVRHRNDFCLVSSIGGYGRIPQIRNLRQGARGVSTAEGDTSRSGYIPNGRGVIIGDETLYTLDGEFTLAAEQNRSDRRLIYAARNSALFGLFTDIHHGVNMSVVQVRSFVGADPFDFRTQGLADGTMVALFENGAVMRVLADDPEEHELFVHRPGQEPCSIYQGQINEWQVAPDWKSVIVLADGTRLFRCRPDHEPEILFHGLKDGMTRLLDIPTVDYRPTRPEMWGQCVRRRMVVTNTGVALLTGQAGGPGRLLHYRSDDAVDVWSDEFSSRSSVALSLDQRPVLLQDKQLSLVTDEWSEVLHDAVPPDTCFLPTPEGAVFKRGNQLWHCMPRD